jgi:hypothetical protein
VEGILTPLSATYVRILTCMQSTTAYAMASSRMQRSSTTHPLRVSVIRQVHRFGGWLEPPYIIGAERHSTSKLLRTL